MLRRIALSSCVLAILVGCGADEGVGKPLGRGGSSGTGSGGSAGSATTGTGGSGGSTGGATGTGGSTGGTGGSTGGSGGATGGSGGATGGSGGATGGTGGATGGTGGATGGTGGATGGTGGATGGTGGATGGTGGATGGTGGATGGTGGATGGTGGTAGAGTGGSAGAKDGGAGTGGTAGTGGSGGTGGTGTTDGGAVGTSKCGAPLFGATPTESSVSANGTLATASYSSGLATSTAYRALNAYYPSNGTGPYVVVLIHPGLGTAASLLGSWGTFLASHGYVGVTVSPPSDGDQPNTRAEALWAAIQTMKAENTRSMGELNGKISNCFVVMGHSMGGGGSLIAANAHPTDIQGVIGLNPWQSNGNFSKIVSNALIITGELDPTAGPAQHGHAHYNSIPATTTKQYVEAAGGDHQSAFSPRGLTARYAVSWIKYNIDGDARYRSLLDKAATGLSTYETTVK